MEEKKKKEKELIYEEYIHFDPDHQKPIINIPPECSDLKNVS